MTYPPRKANSNAPRRKEYPDSDYIIPSLMGKVKRPESDQEIAKYESELRRQGFSKAAEYWQYRGVAQQRSHHSF